MIPILLNSDFSAAFLYLCVYRCREDNRILLSSFWLPTIILLFLFIFFSFTISVLGNHDFVLLLFGTQKQNNTTLRLPENMFLIGLSVYPLSTPGCIYWKWNQERKSWNKKNSLNACWWSRFLVSLENVW